MTDNTVTIRSWRDGREIELDVPDWFYQYEGDITVKTPYSTHVVYNKEPESTRPITDTFLRRNYLTTTVQDDADDDLETNEISFKPFGGDEVIYEVLVTEKVVELFCDSYPPLTIVDA